MRIKRAVVITVFVLALMSTIGVVNADNTATHGFAWPSTTPNGAPPSNAVFPLGVPLYINWAAGGTVKITVTDPIGTVIVIGDELPSSGSLPFTPTIGGTYVVSCTGATSSTFSAGGWFFVLPESALGTLIAVVAGFAAVGTFKMVKRNSAKNKQ